MCIVSALWFWADCYLVNEKKLSGCFKDRTVVNTTSYFTIYFSKHLILILLLLILNLEHLWTVTYMFCSSYCRGNEFISFRLWLRLLSCSVFHAFIFVIANHVCLGKIVSVKNIGISFVGKLIP